MSTAGWRAYEVPLGVANGTLVEEGSQEEIVPHVALIGIIAVDLRNIARGMAAGFQKDSGDVSPPSGARFLSPNIEGSIHDSRCLDFSTKMESPNSCVR